MYDGFRQRRSLKQAADARDRLESADAHRGTSDEFLRRHEQESAEAAKGTTRQRKTFAACLFRRIANSMNLLRAIDHMIANGEQAAGPNGRRLHGLDRFGQVALAQELARSLESGRYTPGPHREVQVAKAKGGHRALKIPNVEDRVVQRAIVQILQPFLDPRFATSSFGFRPTLGREHALAAAKRIVEGGRWCWVVEDIRDAFDQVPHGRLLDVVRMRIFARDATDLIARVVRGNERARRGIPQGGSLSPLMLNVYLDHHLDRPWARACPQWPLIRVADDLLIVCATVEEAMQARKELHRLLTSAAMPLKGTPETTTRNLAHGETATWLGYGLDKGEHGLQARLRDDGPTWDRLRENLVLAHEEPDAPRRALQSIESWIQAHGPCYPTADVRRTHARIAEIARALAFEEIPTVDDVEVLWTTAYERWERVRTKWTGAGEGQQRKQGSRDSKGSMVAPQAKEA